MSAARLEVDGYGAPVRFTFPPAAVVHLDRAADERRALARTREDGGHPGYAAHLRAAHAQHLAGARRAWGPGRALAMIERAVRAR